MSQPTQAPSGKIIVQDNSPVSYLMDTGRFEHCYRIAKLMASASLIPDHLKIDPKSKQPLAPETIAANCFMIVNQAFRWEFDPFSVAPETYIVGGKLAFQGKLVAAAINARAGLEDLLSYTFEGKPGTDDFTITVSGRLKGEAEARTVRVSVGQAKTDNQMWKKDPEQKLVYTGAIKWARRHKPEIILGVLIEDEVEEAQMRNVTPPHIMPEGNPYETLPAPQAAAEETTAEPVEVIPERKAMYAALKDACRDAEVSPATAEARFRKAGLIPDGKTLADTTDEQLFAIYNARNEILPSKVKPQVAEDPESDDGKDLMVEGGEEA